MKLKFVYKVLPVLLLQSSLLVPKKFDAKCYGPLIAFSNKHSINDGALVQHELEHSKQSYRLPLLHPLLYKFSKEYRYKSELDAFVMQLKYYSKAEQLSLVSYFTSLIYQNYNLSSHKTYFEIKTDLVKALGLNNEV